MRIRFIFYIIPILIIRINIEYIFGRFTGYSFGMFVLIVKRQWYNERLLRHELTHCRQFYRTLGLHSIAYMISSNYRAIAEAEAERHENE